MTSTVIDLTQLPSLLGRLIEQGRRVIAPVRHGDLCLFQPISDPGDVAAPETYVTPTNSVKEFFLPKTEAVLAYAYKGRDVALSDAAAPAQRTVIFGCRPCDAASLPIMDQVFDRDDADAFWRARRQATTVIAVSCMHCDSACFCTAVNVGPDSAMGSDLLLTRVSPDQYLVEVGTEKGEAVLREVEDLVGEKELPAGAKAAATARVRQDLGVRFALERIRPWLEDHFEDDFWTEASRPCVGCGVCAFCCPTCHCFDVQDQAQRDRGTRIRIWDSCAFPLFTLHASGHNPRPTQAARWRQRLMHKFSYYLDNFGRTSCVGCGRCIRLCPMGIDIAEQLARIGSRLRHVP